MKAWIENEIDDRKSIIKSGKTKDGKRLLRNLEIKLGGDIGGLKLVLNEINNRLNTK